MTFVEKDVDDKWDDVDELEGWLIDVSKFEKRYDLEPAVRRCLDHPEPRVRAQAIRALGYYLHIDGFAPEAEAFLDDNDDTVVLAAALTWAFYFYNTQDSRVLQRLLELAKNTKHSIAVRAGALGMIMRVLGTDRRDFPVDTLELARATGEEHFQAQIDWDVIEQSIDGS